MTDAARHTTRARAEEALRQAEEKFRSIFENAVEGIFQTMPDGRYLRVNPALAELYGYGSPDELIRSGADITRQLYVTPGRRDEFMRQIERHGSVKNFESQVFRKGGDRIWISENARCVRDETGAVLYYEGFVENISERMRLETQLRQAQKMEAVGLLAGGIAHDFNNMLTVIIGHTDMIISCFGHEDPLQSDLAEIKSAGQRAAALTQQLLAFSRRQFLQPRVLDLNAVIADIIKMLRRLVSEHIELVTTLDPKLAWVKADRGQLEQIIMNLVVNARDVLPQGGRISITTGNVDLDENYVRDHAGAKPGPHVMLAVGDTGPGMDAETQTHIFEPFFTTKEMGKGTGLGLATVYGIVKQSGGYIEVDSAPGKGATFRIYLPQTKEAIEPAAPDQAFDRPLTGTETILLVEDEDQVRKFIRLLLQKYGYTVFEAGQGDEALRICGEHHGPIHLLFSDMVMPGLNGRELAIRVQAVRPETRTLFMSAYTRDAVNQLALMAPGTPFLKKPFSIEALPRKVREVLDAKP